MENYLPNLCEPQSINWKLNFQILMDSVENYDRQWAKREGEELDTLFRIGEGCEVVDTNTNSQFKKISEYAREISL